MTWTTVSDKSTTWANQSDQSTSWEDQREYATNLVLYSEDFSQWTQVVGGEVISNSSIDPFGLYDATLVRDNSTLTFAQVRYAIGEANASNRCFSLFVKKDSTTSRIVAIRFLYVDGATTPNSTLRLNTATGDIRNVTSAATITTVDYGCEDYNTYWRIWLTTSSALQCTHLVFFPAIAADMLALPLEINIGEAVIFGAQLERADAPSGYIKTNGSTVTKVNPTGWAIQ